MSAETVLIVVGSLFGAVVVVMLAMVHLQHRDSNKNRDLIEAARKENRELAGENRELIGKNRELIGDARERLARIEGHLRIVQPAPEAPEDNGDNREAA